MGAPCIILAILIVLVIIVLIFFLWGRHDTKEVVSGLKTSMNDVEDSLMCLYKSIGGMEKTIEGFPGHMPDKDKFKTMVADMKHVKAEMLTSYNKVKKMDRTCKQVGKFLEGSADDLKKQKKMSAEMGKIHKEMTSVIEELKKSPHHVPPDIIASFVKFNSDIAKITKCLNALGAALIRVHRAHKDCDEKLSGYAERAWTDFKEWF